MGGGEEPGPPRICWVPPGSRKWGSLWHPQRPPGPPAPGPVEEECCVSGLASKSAALWHEGGGWLVVERVLSWPRPWVQPSTAEDRQESTAHGRPRPPHGAPSCSQAELLSPLAAVCERFKEQYSTFATALDTTRHELPLKSIHLEGDGHQLLGRKRPLGCGASGRGGGSRMAAHAVRCFLCAATFSLWWRVTGILSPWDDRGPWGPARDLACIGR